MTDPVLLETSSISHSAHSTNLIETLAANHFYQIRADLHEIRVIAYSPCRERTIAPRTVPSDSAMIWKSDRGKSQSLPKPATLIALLH